MKTHYLGANVPPKNKFETYLDTILRPACGAFASAQPPAGQLARDHLQRLVAAMVD